MNEWTGINHLKICKCGLVLYLYKKSEYKRSKFHNIHFPNANHNHEWQDSHLVSYNMWATQWNPPVVILDKGLQDINSGPYEQRNWHLIKHQPMNLHCKQIHIPPPESLHNCSIHFFVWPLFIPLNTLVQINYTTLVSYQFFMVDCR